MNLAQAVRHVKRGLRMNEDEELDPSVIEELQGAQTRLEHDTVLPWFLLEEMASRTSNENGEERVPVPAGFLREYEEGALWRFSLEENRLIELEKHSRRAFSILTPGPPEAYSLDGGYFRLFPIPDKAYQLVLLYYRRDEVVTALTATNKWLTNFPQLLIAEAGLMMATSLDLPRPAAFFASMVDRERNRLMVDNEARNQANRVYRIWGKDN